jgi:hypothetical protein
MTASALPNSVDAMLELLSSRGYLAERSLATVTYLSLRMGRLDGAEFRNGDLEIGQHLQKKRLESLVGAVEFVDQQHRGACDIRLERLQQRPLDQKALRENIARQLLAVGIAGRFCKPDRDHLRGAVPLIDGGGRIKAFITLQADQPASKRRRQNLGDLGLADAGLAFEKQRPSHAQR